MEFKQTYKYIYSIEYYLQSECNSGTIMYKEGIEMKKRTNKITSATEVKRSKAGDVK